MLSRWLRRIIKDALAYIITEMLEMLLPNQSGDEE